jgi:predicted transcriptional regulator
VTDDAQRRPTWNALTGADTEWSRRRRTAGLTISQLAERSGLSRSIVGLIDQGRLVPKLRETEALLRALPAPEADAADQGRGTSS